LARFYCANFRISLAQRGIVSRAICCAWSSVSKALGDALAPRPCAGTWAPAARYWRGDAGVRILRWWRLLLLLCGASCPEREFNAKTAASLMRFIGGLPAVISEYFYDLMVMMFKVPRWAFRFSCVSR